MNISKSLRREKISWFKIYDELLVISNELYRNFYSELSDAFPEWNEMKRTFDSRTEKFHVTDAATSIAALPTLRFHLVLHWDSW